MKETLEHTKHTQELIEHYEALEEARNKINQTKKKIYNRYTVGLMLVAASIAVVTTVFFPPALAVGLVGLAFKATVYASFSISSYLGYELVTQNSVKNNTYEGFSFVTPIANFFGAKKVIDHMNKDHTKKVDFLNEEIATLKAKLEIHNAKVKTEKQPKKIGRTVKAQTAAIKIRHKKRPKAPAKTDYVQLEKAKRSQSSNKQLRVKS